MGYLEVKECMTEKIIQTLTKQMESLLTITYQEFLKSLVNLSGNLKDIECGTHIKIPIPAGYVSCYKSVDALKMSLWISDVISTVDQEITSQEKSDLIERARINTKST